MEPTIKDVQNFWDKRPCNIRHSLLPPGTKSYFDQVEERKYFVEPHIPRFARFEEWKGKKVLEIGCGIGTDAVNFARAGADYTGVDLSEVSIALAKERFKVFNLEGKFLQQDAETIDGLDGGYDLIYSFGVIHHSPHPEKIIKAARRLIKPTGTLKIMLYAKHSWKSFMIEGRLDQPEAQTGCPIAFTYTQDEVINLLEGFVVDKIEQDHIFPYKIEDYINYRYQKQPWFEHMPTEMFAILEKKIGWHLLITAHPC